ncbi:hypothetical protein QEN19_001624 [Hanseniaspora menglaensis]
MNMELKENESVLKDKIQQLSDRSVDDVLINKKMHSSLEEDNTSSSVASSKESENLAHRIKENETTRNNSQENEINFSFPWGSSSNIDKRNSSETTYSNTASSIKTNKSPLNANEYNHEYNFKEGLNENNFCDNLSNACPYSPDNLPDKKLITENHLSEASADNFLMNKTDDTLTSNNINSVFGLPNFSFSPSEFVDIPSTDKSTNSVDFLQTNTLELNNLVYTSNNANNKTSDLALESKLFDDASPMNFNFNFLMNNSIEETPLTKEVKPIFGSDTYENLQVKTENGHLNLEKDIEGVHKSDDDEDADMVVPKDGKLFTCSEIWDRITSNPKLSDLDLDNLCMELKTKAKCSDKGVLIKEEDLDNALLLRQQQKQMELRE